MENRSAGEDHPGARLAGPDEARGPTIVGVLTIAARLVETDGQAEAHGVCFERMEHAIDPVAIAVTRVVIRSGKA